MLRYYVHRWHKRPGPWTLETKEGSRERREAGMGQTVFSTARPWFFRNIPILMNCSSLKVSCNHKRLLSWRGWCSTSLWCYSSCHVWECGEMAEGAQGSYGCQHCDHACRKQGGSASPESGFHWRCQIFCWEGEHLLHGDICPRVHECRECLHRGFDPNLSCGKQESPRHRGGPSSLAQRTDHQYRNQGWRVSCEESRMLLCLIFWR